MTSTSPTRRPGRGLRMLAALAGMLVLAVTARPATASGDGHFASAECTLTVLELYTREVVVNPGPPVVKEDWIGLRTTNDGTCAYASGPIGLPGSAAQTAEGFIVANKVPRSQVVCEDGAVVRINPTVVVGFRPSAQPNHSFTDVGLVMTSGNSDSSVTSMTLTGGNLTGVGAVNRASSPSSCNFNATSAAGHVNARWQIGTWTATDPTN